MKVQKNLALGLIRTKLRLLKLTSTRKAGAAAFELFCTPPTRVKKSSPVFKQHKSIQFRFQGLRIQGYRCGHPASRKVLLLHGFSSGAVNFDHWVNPLLQKGFEVLVFDAPAHGKSEGKRINAVIYSELIEQIVAQFGPLDACIGHSLGGLALSLFLERNPQVPDLKAILIAPATETTTAIVKAFELIGLPNSPIQRAMEKEIEHMSGQPASWFSVNRAIRTIGNPVLWIHDADDDITPLADVASLRNDQPKHIQFHITHGLGHRNIYRDAAVVETSIRFLENSGNW
jgi:pimeloyl-ACP methyl ester carboxylesterase